MQTKKRKSGRHKKAVGQNAWKAVYNGAQRKFLCTKCVKQVTMNVTTILLRKGDTTCHTCGNKLTPIAGSVG